TWQVGMIHGALAIPDRTDGDEVVFTREEIAASGFDYLALGHWHSYQQAVSGGTTYAYSGAPEPVAISQDGAGNVVLVELEATAGGRNGDRKTNPLISSRTLSSSPALLLSLAPPPPSAGPAGPGRNQPGRRGQRRPRRAGGDGRRPDR